MDKLAESQKMVTNYRNAARVTECLFRSVDSHGFQPLDAVIAATGTRQGGRLFRCTKRTKIYEKAENSGASEKQHVRDTFPYAQQLLHCISVSGAACTYWDAFGEHIGSRNVSGVSDSLLSDCGGGCDKYPRVFSSIYPDGAIQQLKIHAVHVEFSIAMDGESASPHTRCCWRNRGESTIANNGAGIRSQPAVRTIHWV